MSTKDLDSKMPRRSFVHISESSGCLRISASAEYDEEISKTVRRLFENIEVMSRIDGDISLIDYLIDGRPLTVIYEEDRERMELRAPSSDENDLVRLIFTEIESANN